MVLTMNEKFNIFEYMLPKNSTQFLTLSATIRQALEKFDYYKYSVIPLIDDDGNYISSISEGDVLRFIKNQHQFNIKSAENSKLSEINLYRPYKAINISAPFNEIVLLALNQNFVPILDDRNKFIGIVKRKSILQYLISNNI